jgi:molecular chaperone DnaK (HSP70)
MTRRQEAGGLVRLGIDFGTTRTVVACSDRGNYPVLGFTDEEGSLIDLYPSVVAEREGELRFGFDALAVASEPGWTVLRSFKRLLSAARISPDQEVKLGTTRMSVLELLTRFLVSLREAVLTRSNRPKTSGTEETLSAVVATPANAHGATPSTPGASTWWCTTWAAAPSMPRWCT